MYTFVFLCFNCKIALTVKLMLFDEVILNVVTTKDDYLVQISY